MPRVIKIAGDTKSPVEIASLVGKKVGNNIEVVGIPEEKLGEIPHEDQISAFR